MKKVFFICFVLVVFFNDAFAQYKRKLREPDFFVPYADRMHKPEVLPKLKKIKKSTNKTPDNKEKNETLFKEIPEYKKIYDNYLSEMTNFAAEKQFRENKNIDYDLSIMNSNDEFEVVGDDSLAITSQEQYDFYMLAKKILDN